MPVMRISGLRPDASIDLEDVLKTLCIEVAKVMDLAPHHVWATWNDIEPGLYVEGDNPARIQPYDTHPPLVDVTAFEGRSSSQIEEVLECIGNALSRALQIEDGNVFITYSEALSGRIYTGGTVTKANYTRDSFPNAD